MFLGGGVPVEDGGVIVGGIGVSGAPGGAEDDACACAGIQAVEDRLLM
ncbi:heme-binding protein [Caldovatus sp. SYSU G05006]|uniref:Heme-binding protein n=1 Tax=Caldovatus aquaticus TaxID=2865671 RepID=A0ABS7F3X2_9PROT|nr:heme-binding protein [Caldovatus aquaticus]